MKVSCIIPTFARDISVVVRTAESLLNLKREFSDYCAEIIIVDQNSPSLNLEEWATNIKSHDIEYIVHNAYVNQNKKKHKFDKIRIIHIVGLNPSLTTARNYGVSISNEELIFFFDDDVIVQPKCIKSHVQVFEKRNDIGVIGGRVVTEPKTFERSKFRELVVSFTEKIIPAQAGEDRYKWNGQYVGRVMPNSFIFARFNSSSSGLIEADTVPAGYCSVMKRVYNEVGGFDENFQGTALREETDFCLRVKDLGYKNYFLGKTYVMHMRQLGGCNNLSTSYSSILSKFENELYFQFKHFLSKSTFYFFFRLMPMVLESFKRTWGISLIMHIQFTRNFYKMKVSKFHRQAYESTLKYPNHNNIDNDILNRKP